MTVDILALIRKAAPDDFDEAVVAWDRDVAYDEREWPEWKSFFTTSSEHRPQDDGGCACRSHGVIFVEVVDDRETWYEWHPAGKRWERRQCRETLTERRERVRRDRWSWWNYLPRPVLQVHDELVFDVDVATQIHQDIAAHYSQIALYQEYLGTLIDMPRHAALRRTLEHIAREALRGHPALDLSKVRAEPDVKWMAGDWYHRDVE